MKIIYEIGIFLLKVILAFCGLISVTAGYLFADMIINIKQTMIDGKIGKLVVTCLVLTISTALFAWGRKKFDGN